MGRAKLHAALDAAEDYAYAHGAVKGRDPREPGARRKSKAEARLQAVVMRHFARQRKSIRDWLALNPPAQKAILPMSLDDALAPDDDFEAEMLRAMLDFTRDGVSLFQETFGFSIDYTLVNTDAAKWARKYVGDKIKEIDTKTKKAVREAVASFVETPGMTKGDLIAMLPYDDARAERIATTEVTRAYAQSNQLSGEEIQREFPGEQVVKKWFTKNDDRVCDICGPLHDTEVDIDDMFTDVGDEPVYTPPAHIGCRCSTTYKLKV